MSLTPLESYLSHLESGEDFSGGNLFFFSSPESANSLKHDFCGNVQFLSIYFLLERGSQFQDGTSSENGEVRGVEERESFKIFIMQLLETSGERPSHGLGMKHLPATKHAGDQLPFHPPMPIMRLQM